MPKPTQIPTWATDPAAQITEPINARKTLGWLPGDALPAQELNWILNRQGQWLDWLEKASRGAEVFTALDVAGSVSVGGDLDVDDHLFVGSGVHQRALIPESPIYTQLNAGAGYSPYAGWTFPAGSDATIARYAVDPATRTATITGRLGELVSAMGVGVGTQYICDLPNAIRPGAGAHFYGTAFVEFGSSTAPVTLEVSGMTLALRKGTPDTLPAGAQVCGTIRYSL